VIEEYFVRLLPLLLPLLLLLLPLLLLLLLLLPWLLLLLLLPLLGLTREDQKVLLFYIISSSLQVPSERQHNLTGRKSVLGYICSIDCTQQFLFIFATFSSLRRSLRGGSTILLGGNLYWDICVASTAHSSSYLFSQHLFFFAGPFGAAAQSYWEEI